MMDAPTGGRTDETTDADDRDPVEALADEFVARRRKGERPSVEEYAERCPDRAGEIRELFPAIAAMERWKPRPTSGPDRPADGGGMVVPPRDRLGEYRLIREIGRGGMGVVYEAEQESLGRRVAVKVLPGAHRADGRPMERFLREAKTAAGLWHGNIVPVFASGIDDGLPYYVMPLIPGVGLDRVIAELRRRLHGPGPDDLPAGDDAATIADSLLEGSPSASASATIPPAPTSSRVDPLPPTEPGPRYWEGVARVGIQVAEALRHAHDAGVLHRDIKPANLLMDASGVVWVADFGLAKAMGHDDLSRSGDLVGTLRYMAPERLRGACDARSDLYSLGLTLYELAALRPAYESPDRAELIRKIAEARPPRLRDAAPGLPPGLETSILKAIDPDPGRRYASAGAMAEDLRRFLDGRPVLARKANPPARLARWIGQNRAVAALAGTSIALALVASVFIALFLLAPPMGPPPPRRPDAFDPDRPDRPPPPRWFRPRPPGPPPPPRD